MSRCFFIGLTFLNILLFQLVVEVLCTNYSTIKSVLDIDDGKNSVMDSYKAVKEPYTFILSPSNHGITSKQATGVLPHKTLETVIPYATSASSVHQTVLSSKYVNVPNAVLDASQSNLAYSLLRTKAQALWHSSSIFHTYQTQPTLADNQKIRKTKNKKFKHRERCPTNCFCKNCTTETSYSNGIDLKCKTADIKKFLQTIKIAKADVCSL